MVERSFFGRRFVFNHYFCLGNGFLCTQIFQSKEKFNLRAICLSEKLSMFLVDSYIRDEMCFY